MLDEREAFLRAIFDSPADDVPKLVFADWLDEHGEEAFARLLRMVCETDPADAITDRLWAAAEEAGLSSFAVGALVFDAVSEHGTIEVEADLLADAHAFRTRAATTHLEWFLYPNLAVTGGRITDGRPFDILFSAPAARRVTALSLGGIEEPIVGSQVDESGAVFGLAYDFRYRPVVTPAGVAALAAHRGAHRLQVLDLTNNDLDNDAARALVRSPFLDNLRELRLRDGNRLRGRVWAQVVERFGEDVAT